MTNGTLPRNFLRMPVLPVAGLFWRVAALVMDFLIIFLAINVLSRNFLPAVIALDRLYPYVTGVATFLYFALMNGPLGKGRTFGKMAVGLVVTDYDGGTPTLAQSILRTVILYPAFVLSPLHDSIFGRPETLQQTFVSHLITGFPMIAMWLATMLVVPFNPFKQGPHDYPSKTLVQRVPRENPKYRVTFDELRAMIGGEWLKFHRQPQISGLVTFTLVVVLLAILYYPGRAPEKHKEFAESLLAIQQVDGFREADVALPWPAEEYLKEPSFGPYPEDEHPDFAAMLTSDVPDTTGTLSLVVDVVHEGRWQFDATTPQNRRHIDALAEKYHSTILPAFIRLNGDTENPKWRKMLDDWKSKPMVLRFVFVQQLISAPQIFRYRVPVSVASRQFEAYSPEQFEIDRKGT